MDKKVTGDFGETIATSFLKLQGYRIVERNFRCRQGEIDIVASKDKEIVFVEVKTRLNNAFGTPAEAVGRAKRERLKRAGMFYLHCRGMDYHDARFDVLEIGLNHIENVI